MSVASISGDLYHQPFRRSFSDPFAGDFAKGQHSLQCNIGIIADGGEMTYDNDEEFVMNCRGIQFNTRVNV